MRTGWTILFCGAFAASHALAAQMTANFGTASGAAQLSISKSDGLDSAVFTDVTIGAGVKYMNAAQGVSTPMDSLYTPEYAGSRGYGSWNLDGTNLTTAIATDHYIQFALTVNSNEVSSLDSIAINGVVISTSIDTYALFVSTDDFSSPPVSGEQVAEGTFRLVTGGAVSDASDPYSGYDDVDFSPTSPLVPDAETVTYTFRLYITEDGLGDARPLGLNYITFYMTRVPGPVSDGPNIIYILTDDHGRTDLGIYGIDPLLQTPNLDSLATNGVLFTDGYSTAPQCRPSRAGVLSGRCQNRFGYTNNRDNAMPLVDPWGQPVITIAERMRDRGYRTGQVGKWHLSPPPPDPNYANEILYDPDHRGFMDQFNGTDSPYMANFDLSGNDIERQSVAVDGHRIDVQTEAARAFIQRAHDRDEPFFLYLAYYAPHTPRITDTNYYANFPTVDYPEYDAEEDDIRRQGLAVIKAIDTGVGSIMQKLRDLGIEENTVIFLAGDNAAPLGHTPDLLRNLTSWDGSENHPFRGEKGSTWEGGIRVPMLMYWKDNLPARTVYTNPVVTFDLSATAVELAGGSLPSGYDGVNLMPYLTNAVAVPHETLFWNYGIDGWGYTVNVRQGNWKLHQFSDKDFLFNLVDDPEEAFNLADAMPMKLAELKQLGQDFLAELPDNGVEALSVSTETTIDSVNQDPIVMEAWSDTDGDGMSNLDEPAAGRDPDDASDLAFEFGFDGYQEGWNPIDIACSASNGFLQGVATNGTSKLEFYDFNFDAGQIANMMLRIKAPVSSGLVFRWGTSVSNTFSETRKVVASYVPGTWNPVVIPLSGHPEWDSHVITKMRVNPVNVPEEDFEIDWLRGSTRDLDLDLLPDTYEWTNGYDAADMSDGTADGDSDGMTLGQEYVAGTDDDDPTSVFAVQGTSSEAGPFSLRWNGRAGRAYTVWTTPQLIPPLWTVQTNCLLSIDSSVELKDLAADAEGPRFYKVEVELP